MSEIVRVTTDDELDAHFIGVMIEAEDFDVGEYHVPGWECRRCGWRVGAIGYPPSHTCPDDGSRQKGGE